MSDSGGRVSRLAEKLSWLMENVPTADGSPATEQSVTDYLTERGLAASPVTIGGLRTGRLGSTSPQVLHGVADYFGVPHEYWTVPVVEQAVRTDLILLDNLLGADRATLMGLISEVPRERLEVFTAAMDELEKD